jgi:hypothetical protein
MASDLPHYSRYIDTEQVFWKKEESFGLYEVSERIKSLKPKDLISIKITTGLAGRPDLIAQENYGTPYYSWVIVIHNSPLNPIGLPKQGDVITIPTATIVDFIIHGG